MKITCNKCGGKFGEASQPRFAGRMAVRLSEFTNCPHCGQTDTHWLYARDAAPEFTAKAWLDQAGAIRARERALQQWVQEN